jgi:hypothetical protein
MGEYVMTREDVLAAREFEDGVARGSWPVDIHDPVGKGISSEILTYPPMKMSAFSC